MATPLGPYSPPWFTRGAGDSGFFGDVPTFWLSGASFQSEPVDEYTGGVSFGIVTEFAQLGNVTIGQPTQFAQIGGNGLFSINGPGIIPNFGPFGLSVGPLREAGNARPDTSRPLGYVQRQTAQGAAGGAGAAGAAGGAGAPWPPRATVTTQFRHSLLPVGGTGGPDERFEPRPVVPPPGHPSYPGGTRVVLMETTEEGKQVTVPFHADPRLVLANKGPSSSYGTPVCEVTDRGDISENRTAPLHTFLRVVSGPTKAGERGPNTLAWQIGFSGRKDALAGMVAENGYANEDVPRLARVSRIDGGPFDAMGPKCKHRLGTDSEGSAVNPLHFGVETLFHWADKDPMHDGPLAFTIEDAPEATFVGYPQQVRFGWDRTWIYTNAGRTFRGAWQWWTRAVVGTTAPPDQPPPRGPITPSDPPPVPPIPGPNPPPVPGPITPRGPTIQTDGTRSLAPRDHASTAFALGVPALVFRARRVAVGAPDTAYNVGATPDEISAYERSAPAVLRVEAFGEQSATDFVRTQEPGRSTHRAGTADGGVWHFVPEVALEDSSVGFTSDSNRTVSSATVGYGPGVAVVFGTPSTTTGGAAEGVRVKHDGSGAAKIAASTDGATWTDLVRYTVDGTNFKAPLSIDDGKDIAVATTTGTKIGTGTTQKIGFWNATPVPQFGATTGTTAGFTSGSSDPVLKDSTFTGDNGTKAYTIGDIVKALKAAGIMAAS